ncbi:AMP-binding protein [Streptomyces cyaneus]|uniref:AMP-binding protein n=1 Tax=Streptomyces cyaneus TaxID=1904 RepID=UPI000FF893E9|nr:AMP-binding protein [Streptomyces cyaneus]
MSSSAEVIVCEEGRRAGVEAVRVWTRLRRFLLVDDDPEVPTAGAEGREPWSPLITTAQPTIEVVPGRTDDPVIPMFTSGPTGTPKGVVLTHGNTWWSTGNGDIRPDTRRGDVTCVTFPNHTKSNALRQNH